MLEACAAESHTFRYGPPDESSDDLPVPNLPPASSPSWPNQSRTINCFNEVDSLILDDRHLYCPLKSNDPLFDSFCLERSSKGVMLWVFQMTIAKEYGGAVPGFSILSTIVQKIRATLMASEVVEVKFVLVAPNKSGQVVKWNFSKELVNSLDKVYVQYLDVSFDNYDYLLEPPWA